MAGFATGAGRAIRWKQVHKSKWNSDHGPQPKRERTDLKSESEV